MKNHGWCNWCLCVQEPPSNLELVLDDNYDEETIIKQDKLKLYINHYNKVIQIYKNIIFKYYQQYSIFTKKLCDIVFEIINEILIKIIDLNINVKIDSVNYKDYYKYVKDCVEANHNKDCIIRLIMNIVNLIEDLYIIINKDDELYLKIKKVNKYNSESLYYLLIFIGLNRQKYNINTECIQNLSSLYVLQILNLIDNTNIPATHKLINTFYTDNKIVYFLHKISINISMLILKKKIDI